jgi:4-amino-4-deoxy-L-arabinose transferase-like glycosyltransferase
MPIDLFSIKDRDLLLLLLGYIAVIALLRLGLFDAVGLDDAEQLVWSQQLQLGYGTQPPLYTWLLWVATRLFGVNLVTVVLLRECLFGAILLFAYLGVRAASENRHIALLATLSLLLYPQIVIDLHKEATHTLLLSIATALTFYLCARLLRQPGNALYLLTGLAVAMGMLSKYSFVVFVTALLLTGLSFAAGRRVLFDRRFLLTIAGAIVPLLPHGYWMMHIAPESLAAVGNLVASETASAGDWAVGGSALVGILDLLRAYLGVVVLLLAVYAWILLRSRPAGPGTVDPSIAPLARQLSAGLLFYQSLLFIVGVLLFSASSFHTHWMPPLLLTLPLLLLSLAGDRLNPTTMRRLLNTCLTFVILLPLLWFASMLAPDLSGKSARISAPFDEVAAAVRSAGFTQGEIIAPYSWIAGNLRLQFPSSRVLTRLTDAQGGPALYISEAGKHTGPAPFGDQSSTRISLKQAYSNSQGLSFDYWIR